MSMLLIDTNTIRVTYFHKSKIREYQLSISTLKSGVHQYWTSWQYQMTLLSYHFPDQEYNVFKIVTLITDIKKIR